MRVVIIISQGVHNIHKSMQLLQVINQRMGIDWILKFIGEHQKSLSSVTPMNSTKRTFHSSSVEYEHSASHKLVEQAQTESDVNRERESTRKRVAYKNAQDIESQRQELKWEPAPKRRRRHTVRKGSKRAELERKFYRK